MMISKFRNYEKNIDEVKKQNINYEKQIEEMNEKRENLVVELGELRAKVVENKNYCEKCLTDFIKK